MIWKFITFFVRKLDPEIAHKITIKFLKLGLHPRLNKIGIPINIVIGKKFKDEKQVEVIERNNEKKLVKESELVNYLTKFFQE